MLLATSEAVASFCKTLCTAPYITVDTEFLSEKRFRPDLCLLQIGAPGHAAAIDPLAPGIDLSPVAALLADPNLLKVFHAGSQDVGIFIDVFGVLPAPLLDTQVMASVCGFGDQAGYATLCKRLLDVEIDKTNQATDWSLRPLTDEQVEYALGDVTHLRDLYRLLTEKLDALGRTSWVAEEHAMLADPASYTLAPERAWRKIRVRRPTPRTIAILGALAAWREETAARRNQPRGWVVHNDALVEVAEQLPSTVEELARVRRLSASVAKGRDGQRMLAIVAEILAQPEESWPVPAPDPVLTGAQKALVLLLQALLELRCDEHDVGTNRVANSSELKQIVLGDHEGLRSLEGWRGEVFGQDALRLMSGRLTLTGSVAGAVVRT